MRLYPSVPSRRRATLAGDLAVLLLLAVFAWLGFKVHDAVAELAGLGRGLQDSGAAVSATARDATGAVRDGLGSAAGAVAGVPVVGGPVADALRSAGDSATRPVQQEADAQARKLVEAGRRGEAQALSLARLLGWLTFLVPAILLLSRALPARIGQARRWGRAEALLRGAPEEELARRAAYHLPYAVLARHTRDPFGELHAGRFDALLAALEEEAGVRVRVDDGGGAVAAPRSGGAGPLF